MTPKTRTLLISIALFHSLSLLDIKSNFSNYRNRFQMPGNTESLYYSFDMGPVHFIGISTELYYFLNYGIKSLANQYEWLVNDLREANKPENRAIRPFIVVFGHRPMYCSNTDNIFSCQDQTTLLRTGLPITHLYGLEELFLNSGVDISIWAHQHSYERLWPVYNYEVRNGSFEEPYKNAKAPIHIITGSAGCKEDHAEFQKDPPAWSAFRSVVSLFGNKFSNVNLKTTTNIIINFRFLCITGLWIHPNESVQ